MTCTRLFHNKTIRKQSRPAGDHRFCISTPEVSRAGNPAHSSLRGQSRSRRDLSIDLRLSQVISLWVSQMNPVKILHRDLISRDSSISGQSMIWNLLPNLGNTQVRKLNPMKMVTETMFPH